MGRRCPEGRITDPKSMRLEERSC